MLDVPLWAWALTVGVIIVMLVVDFVGHVRTPHAPTLKESALWSAGYVAIALLFGAIVWVVGGPDFGQEFFAGYITEWSLSVDNLFVFLVILTRFAVPTKYRQRVLLIGVAIALVLRGLFIAVGAAALAAFTWVFYLFGIFLIWTAISVAKEGGAEEGDVEYEENRLTRWVRKVFPGTDGYRGAALFVKENGRRLITPMLIVMIAIGTNEYAAARGTFTLVELS